MNRRNFLLGVAAATLSPTQVFGSQSSAPVASLSIGSVRGTPVPEEFVGLSYESAQLANPEFFSPRNHALIRVFRDLAPAGNLRLGGGSSEYTTYSAEQPAGPLPFEVFGADTSKTVKTGTVTFNLALRNLRRFLDAVNWSCLYGLNLGQGTVDNAVRESAAVHRILGPRLLAFQIGNEPDSFRRRFRPATYGPADYLAEWTRFHDAIVAITPEARFAGPDISNKLAYLTAFAEQARQHPDIVLLTSHYYAMGPARSPSATIQNLLQPDPQTATLKDRDLHVIAEAQQASHLPYRMSEGNSCWDGGKPGVSDTFASALWCADYMLRCATRGWTGVNMHGGGDGYYTPIAGAPSSGFSRRPEYFGMQFAQHFVGTRAVDCELAQASALVDAFVFERDGKHELAIINKSDQSFHCRLPQGSSGVTRLLLTGPSIEARDGVELRAVHARHKRQIALSPYTAGVFELRYRDQA